MEPKIIFKRKITEKLLQWKNESKGEKALLIEGARRIGKSTAVEEFAKAHYRSYILIDFNKASSIVFDDFRDNLEKLDTFFMVLSAAYGKTLYPRESLIIFDEVQAYPKAREAIKYLVADGRYDYIETGSLISIKQNVRGITIPSEERKIKMYPMDFEEFVWALGEEQLLPYIRDCFEKRIALERGLHERAMMLFKQYMLVGGMPKALSKFLLARKQFADCDAEKRDILVNYRDDIMKIDAQYKAKVLSIFDQIPSFLSMHEKRVRLRSIESDTNYPEYEETFFWLADSMVCNECFACSDPNVGLSLNESRAAVKCYMGDTGLLVSHAFDENELIAEEVYASILSGKLSVNEGMLYENAIAQMLVASGHKLYFYTHYSEEKKRNDIEIDFLLSNGSKTKPKIFPIEVKSSKNYANVSLTRFVDKYKARIGGAFILHPKNLFVRSDGIVALPCYMAYLL